MAIEEINWKVFLATCDAADLPTPEPEYYFCRPHRQWRFDWYFGEMVALEVEGGAFKGHGHRSIGKYLRDIEKYNEAAIRGYRLIRCTVQDIIKGTWVQPIQRALDGIRGIDVGLPPATKPSKRRRRKVKIGQSPPVGFF